MRAYLHGRLEFSGVTAELLTYEWDDRENNTLDITDVRLVRLASRSSRNSLLVSAPGQPPRPLRSLSLIPSGTIIVEGGPGRATFSACAFSQEEFAEMLQSNCDWQDTVHGGMHLQNSFLSAILGRIWNLNLSSSSGNDLAEALSACLRAELRCYFDNLDLVKLGPGQLSRAEIERITIYIMDTLKQERTPSLSEIADIASLGTRQMVRSYKLTTGRTIHNDIRKSRMEIVKSLLEGEKWLPMREIARRCGFVTASHFSAEFHKLVGTTPSRYRRCAAMGDRFQP